MSDKNTFSFKHILFVKARSGLETKNTWVLIKREIKGSAKNGLESTRCSQKWHREYLVVIKELISEPFKV